MDEVFGALNAQGVIPILEDGFRTEGEQSDRRKKYPIAARTSWHEVGLAIDFKASDPNSAAIEKAMVAAGFRNGRSFDDVGHFDLASGGSRSQSAADACSREHPNGT